MIFSVSTWMMLAYLKWIFNGTLVKIIDYRCQPGLQFLFLLNKKEVTMKKHIICIRKEKKNSNHLIMRST